MVPFPSFIFRMWDTLVFSTLGLMQLDSWRLMFSCSLDRGEQDFWMCSDLSCVQGYKSNTA